MLEFLRVPVDPPTPVKMEDYAEEYFNLDRKGLFGKKTTVFKILGWKAVRDLSVTLQ